MLHSVERVIYSKVYRKGNFGCEANSALWLVILSFFTEKDSFGKTVQINSFELQANLLSLKGLIVLLCVLCSQVK
ncbi:MAG: hypothetical protein ACJAS3_002112 [Roseivirga sp.]|jgi:hypothetical protein